jgi:hypothetical protein
MIEEGMMHTWVTDELEVVERNKRFLEGHLLVWLFPRLIDEISRYERSLKTFKKCIDHEMYSSM